MLPGILAAAKFYPFFHKTFVSSQMPCLYLWQQKAFNFRLILLFVVLKSLPKEDTALCSDKPKLLTLVFKISSQTFPQAFRSWSRWWRRGGSSESFCQRSRKPWGQTAGWGACEVWIWWVLWTWLLSTSLFSGLPRTTAWTPLNRNLGAPVHLQRLQQLPNLLQLTPSKSLTLPTLWKWDSPERFPSSLDHFC